MNMNSAAEARAGIAEDGTIRRALLPYVAPSTPKALALFLGTAILYGAAIDVAASGAMPVWARIAGSVIAGLAIPSLFVIGHDAAHGAFTARRRLNAVLARVAFLPALHNASLWQAVHNRRHHRLPNLKGNNSWSPLSHADYLGLSPAGRARQRLYRSPLGFAPYYLIERWWRDKFVPRGPLPGVKPAAAWRDFSLIFFYLLVFVGTLYAVGGVISVILGFVVPFLVWNGMMGATTYLQHTGRRTPWYDSVGAWRRHGSDEQVTIQLRVPRWYGLVSHHVMDHPAHHFQPRIPLYRLPAAQARLNELLGERAVFEEFSPAYLLRTLRACKLYDYESRRWLDFAGNPTGVDPPAVTPRPVAATVA